MYVMFTVYFVNMLGNFIKIHLYLCREIHNSTSCCLFCFYCSIFHTYAPCFHGPMHHQIYLCHSYILNDTFDSYNTYKHQSHVFTLKLQSPLSAVGQNILFIYVYFISEFQISFHERFLDIVKLSKQSNAQAY